MEKEKVVFSVGDSIEYKDAYDRWHRGFVLDCNMFGTQHSYKVLPIEGMLPVTENGWLSEHQVRKITCQFPPGTAVYWAGAATRLSGLYSEGYLSGKVIGFLQAEDMYMIDTGSGIEWQPGRCLYSDHRQACEASGLMLDEMGRQSGLTMTEIMYGLRGLNRSQLEDVRDAVRERLEALPYYNEAAQKEEKENTDEQ